MIEHKQETAEAFIARHTAAANNADAPPEYAQVLQKYHTCNHEIMETGWADRVADIPPLLERSMNLRQELESHYRLGCIALYRQAMTRKWGDVFRDKLCSAIVFDGPALPAGRFVKFYGVRFFVRFQELHEN